jgi:hypothetical protein
MTAAPLKEGREGDGRGGKTRGGLTGLHDSLTLKKYFHKFLQRPKKIPFLPLDLWPVSGHPSRVNESKGSTWYNG